MTTTATAHVRDIPLSVAFDAGPFLHEASAVELGAILRDMAYGTKARTQDIARALWDRPGYEALAEVRDAVDAGHALAVEVRREDIQDAIDRKREALAPLGALFDAAAGRVAQAFEAAMLTRSPFHLSACGGCGGPSFGQPCALCGYYPYGSPRPSDLAPPATRDGFVTAVRGSAPGGKGNLATWYVASFRRTAAYKDSARYRASLDDALALAAGLDGMPEPGPLFDYVTAGGAVRRPAADRAASRMWAAMGELDMAAHQGLSRASHARELDEAKGLAGMVADAKKTAVAAIHAGEGMQEAVDGLERAVDRFMDITPRPSWLPVGNLLHAQREIDEIREGLHASAPTP